MSKIYYESLEEAIERNKPNIASTKRKLEDAGSSMFYLVGLICMEFQKLNLFQ